MPTRSNVFPLFPRLCSVSEDEADEAKRAVANPASIRAPDRDQAPRPKPMTSAQRRILKDLAERSSTKFDPSMTKAEALQRIVDLRAIDGAAAGVHQPCST